MFWGEFANSAIYNMPYPSRDCLADGAHCKPLSVDVSRHGGEHSDACIQGRGGYYS